MSTSDRFLYHYCGADALLSILKTRTLWATDLRYLNDRFEGRVVADFLSSIATQPELWAIGEATRNTTAWATYKHSLSYGMLFKVVCFSRNENSLPMFRMYAPPAGGFVVGFPESFLQEVGHLHECEYGDDHAVAWCRNYVQRFVAEAELHDEPELSVDHLLERVHRLTTLVPDRLAACVRFKKADFRNENEVRMIPLSSQDLYRPAKDGNAIIPYSVVELPNRNIEIRISAGPNRDADLASHSLNDFQRAANSYGTNWLIQPHHSQTNAFRA